MMKTPLDHLLAKSEPRETLLEHTVAVVKVWHVLCERYGSILNVPDEFWKHGYWSALFHDFGKMCGNFQDMLNREPGWKERTIRHEFISGMFMLYANAPEFQAQPLSLFAVFSHHKPLTDNLFQKDALQTLVLPQADAMALENELVRLSIEEGFSFVVNQKGAQQIRQMPIGKMYVQFEKFLKKATCQFEMKHRRLYILFKAMLNIADWTASAHRSLPDGLTFSKADLEERIIEKLKHSNKDWQNFRFREFQTESLKAGSIIAIAPTGSGKTEAALLWASQKKEFEKVFYLLPTRVTSNAIYERLKQYFGKDNCALVHSSAIFYEKDLNDQFDDRSYLMRKTFFGNINVCTVDQLLTQGFNLGFWEIKTFYLLRANVILDEIHLYEPYTLGLIISSINYIRIEFEARFFVMTATMPQKLLLLLQKTMGIGEENTIRDTALLDEARNVFEIRETLADGIREEIEKWLSLKKKVLIVVNTVDEAIRLYEYYKSLTNNILCYHSRFIQKDRQEKERQILHRETTGESFLLIATQVVEVSLDIDFDVLFTENAPMDAIIQRAGRVNRGRKKRDSKVIVFRHQPVTEEHIYNREDFLNKTFSLLKEKNGMKLTERALTELVDKVYENFEIEADEDYRRGLKAYAEIQQKNHFIKDNTETDSTYTREGLDTVTVIPMVFFEILRDKVIQEKQKYEVSIRKKRASPDKIIKDARHPWVKYFDCHYNDEVGLQFKTNANRYKSPQGITQSY